MMANLAQSIKLAGVISCSTLLVSCTLLRTKTANPRAFRIETMPIAYESLASQPAMPLGKVFQLSFYDQNQTGQQVIQTVDVTPLQYRDNNPYMVLDHRGREYELDSAAKHTQIAGKSLLPQTPRNWYGQGAAIVFERKPGTLIIPLLPNQTYVTVKAKIQQTGGKVLGIFGKTFEGSAPPDASARSYVYFNPNHLPQNAGKTNLPIYRSSENPGQSAGNLMLSGQITYSDGRSTYLDFASFQGEGKTPTEQHNSLNQQISQQLEQLEAQSEVVMVTLDTHGVIRSTTDIEAVWERGEYQQGGPFKHHETQSVARGIRVFDDQTKAYLGSMITPSLLMKDCLKVAQQKFGEDAVIQFLEGEASAAAYFEDYNPTSDLGVKDPDVLHSWRLKDAQGLELIVQYD